MKHWVESFVIDLNLCPFARRELLNDRIRFHVIDATTEGELLEALADELRLLDQSRDIETTLLIHPGVLLDFLDFNQFITAAEVLLADLGFEGTFQIASFHPDYQFAGTDPADAGNYTNRAPFPILHLLRESSVEKAVTGYPDIDQVPERNIATMNQLGMETLRTMLDRCLEQARSERTAGD